MSQNLSCEVAVIAIDIGKNSFHAVGLDARGAILLRQKGGRVARANMPPCLIQRKNRGMNGTNATSEQGLGTKNLRF